MGHSSNAVSLPPVELLTTDPKRHLEMANKYIRQSPDDAEGYCARNLSWCELGRPDLALGDLNKAIEIDPSQFRFYFGRGSLLRDAGRYREAIDDFSRAIALDEQGQMGVFGPLLRADCHARLGNEAAALADCAAVPDDHWTPGVANLPAGGRDEIAAEFRRMAATARGRRIDR
jgi:tetratricopeptide (TPR) repeat protein